MSNPRLQAAADKAATEAKDELERAFSLLSAERQRAAEQSDRVADLEESQKSTLAKLVARDEAAEKALDETLAALEFVRGEKAALEVARADLAGNLDRALQEKQGIVANLERMASDLRRVQQASTDLALAQEAARAQALTDVQKAHEIQIHALRFQLVNAEAALSNAMAMHLRAGILARLLPPSFRRRLMARQLVRSGLLDPSWYFGTYPDAGESGLSAAEHYLETGFWRGYRPNPFFDTHFYLERYPDVRGSGVNPLLHYFQHGWREGRDPGPDFQTDFYLGENPDVRATGVNPLMHYLRYGRHEGRLPAAADVKMLQCGTRLVGRLGSAYFFVSFLECGSVR